MPHYDIIASELSIRPAQVKAVAELLEQDCTVPFIARYRKEATGSLDDEQVALVRDRLEQLAALDKRREAILKSLAERDLLTPELEKAVNAAPTLAELEDVYLPHRPKRRTRAQIAREKGLEPLAEKILAQKDFDVQAEAARYVDADKDVNDVVEALSGARDIIAEAVSEHQAARAALRRLYETKAVLASRVVKGKEEEGAKFRDWFEFSELAAKSPSHRVLAICRGEAEGILSVSARTDEVQTPQLLKKGFVKGQNEAARQVGKAVEDAYKRLLAPSMENELRRNLKDKADDEAIRVFAENLRELLMAAPLGHKRVMALDPGFRTGAKLVCLDEKGDVLHFTTVYPTRSRNEKEQAAKTVKELHDRFSIEAVAVGNGTASRETEAFLKELALGTPVVMVSESGASVYSASETAREEFPDLDVTARGAISIGRRLMDPLAELVKIDPKAIGVGQYQHDVDQAKLKKALDTVVESCVNRVGVDANLASAALLSYVSGLGPALAKNIVAHRAENGPFRSRKEILKVKRLGPKAFQQCAGFLRIPNAKNPLDASAVHPESYEVVEAMARDLGVSVSDLMRDEELREKIDLKRYVSESIGLPTLSDIMQELAKPGRDPREEFTAFSFAENVHEVKDLVPGMKLPGIVTNVTRFGAFVDVGVHQDGLVHISQLADRYVSAPSEVVRVGQKVEVTVLEVDVKRQRISLSMRES